MVPNNRGRSCDWERESVTLSEMCRSLCPTLEGGGGWGLVLSCSSNKFLVEKGWSLLT